MGWGGRGGREGGERGGEREGGEIVVDQIDPDPEKTTLKKPSLY